MQPKSTASLWHGVRRLHTVLLVVFGSVGTAMAVGEYAPYVLSVTQEQKLAQECPRCEDLFTELTTDNDGKRVQILLIDERGEAKSGTSFMMQWARGVLDRTCAFLNRTYGEGTCGLEHDGLRQYMQPSKIELTFDPSLARGDAGRCPCHGVDMVKISISGRDKHVLPVEDTCRWAHVNGIVSAPSTCDTVGGKPVENTEELFSCMMESDCHITGENCRQMVIMRDPRAVAVSSYFYILAHPETEGRKKAFWHADASMEDVVMAFLPVICKWMTIRHILFEGLMAETSMAFWYEEALNNPLPWHYRMAALAGLQLPSTLVESMAADAATGNFSFESAGLNDHVGGEEASPARKWQDEINPELIPAMNEVLRLWLPSVIIARLGVAL